MEPTPEVADQALSEPTCAISAYLYTDGLLDIGPDGFGPDPAREVAHTFGDYLQDHWREVSGTYCHPFHWGDPECWPDVITARIAEPLSPLVIWGMFSGFKNLVSVDLSNLDTSRCVEMRQLFRGCSSLTALDLSDFDTSACWNLASMFEGCSALTALDLSGFDTSSCRSMDKMFYGCTSLEFLDLSSFDTSKCDGFLGMLYGCNAQPALEQVRSFDFSLAAKKGGGYESLFEKW